MSFEFFRYFWLQFWIVKIDALPKSHQLHLHCAYFIGNFLYMSRFILQLYGLMSLIEMINSTFQHTSALYFYLLIVMDSILYKQDHWIFWKTLQKITGFYLHRRNYTFGHLILKLMVHLFTASCCFCVFALFMKQLYEYTYVYLLLMKMCQIRIFYYIFCVEILYDQMQSISNELRKNKKDKTFWLQSNGLRKIRINYSHIHGMTNCLTQVFGLSQVAAISYSFYMLLTDINWLSTLY